MSDSLYAFFAVLRFLACVVIIGLVIAFIIVMCYVSLFWLFLTVPVAAVGIAAACAWVLPSP